MTHFPFLQFLRGRLYILFLNMLQGKYKNVSKCSVQDAMRVHGYVNVSRKVYI